MTNQTKRRRGKRPSKIRKSQVNELNLIPFSSQQPVENVIIKRNVNQLWDWRTLEDVKF